MKYTIQRNGHQVTIKIELSCAAELTVVRMGRKTEWDEPTIEVKRTKPEFQSEMNPLDMTSEAFGALADVIDEMDQVMRELRADQAPSGWYP